MSYRLGVDVGARSPTGSGRRRTGVALTRKVLSSTGNYAEAIVQGASELMAAAASAPRTSAS